MRGGGRRGGSRGRARKTGAVGDALRPARTGGGSSRPDRWEQLRTRLADERDRLTPGRLGSLECLVRHVDLLLQLTERRIVVNRPPVGTAGRIARLGRLPTFRFLEVLWHRRTGAVVVRADRAGGQ